MDSLKTMKCTTLMATMKTMTTSDQVEIVGVGSPFEARTKRFKSDTWKEYVPILVDGEVAKEKCKHCEHEISTKRGAGTSSLLNHLQRCKKRTSALKVVDRLKSTIRSPHGVRLRDWSFDSDVSWHELMRMISLHKNDFLA